LIEDSDGGRIGVVFKDAAGIAVGVDVVALNQDVVGDVRARRADEQAVAAIAEDAVADGDILAEFDVDRRR
jgi:hypothetical protein